MERGDNTRWQWVQHLIGAILTIAPAGYFLFCMAEGALPADFNRDISLQERDHRRIDHLHIASAIGSCHVGGDVSTWPADWLRTLRISNADFIEPAPAQAVEGLAPQLHDGELSAFERAALWHSERIGKERESYLHDAQERQDRARRNQLRVLCLSAAAAFLVSLKALTANKDADVAFRSVVSGAVLPISVLALLMPVLVSVVSGVATFDGDPNIVVRDVRTLSQLEQLHGRIGEDITSDRFFAGSARRSTRRARVPAWRWHRMHRVRSRRRICSTGAWRIAWTAPPPGSNGMSKSSTMPHRH
jgi:hypothetical protein